MIHQAKANSTIRITVSSAVTMYNNRKREIFSAQQNQTDKKGSEDEEGKYRMKENKDANEKERERNFLRCIE